MKPIKIAENVYKIGALDWNRRLFDSLIPIPKGTTYNSYWVEGKEKTALIDTVEPAMWEVLEDQISKATRLDYIVSNHAEQDHSGCIPNVLQKFPKAKVVTNSKAKGMLMDLLSIEESQFQIVNDGDSLDLGGKTLRFALTPWVHWPETMVTYLEEDKILFSCDFFGSHLASSKIYADEDYEVYDAAKRYYAEIMMPFAREVAKNMEKVSKWNIQLIAPSHGPMYNKPEFIFNAYKEWISDKPKNKAIVVYIS
ncbi:MAG: MBL fold metallo-hydrolase, partial [Candidatus Brocadiae bacterium]|nr:MBL fold metallo-hydrolase [Candidatus Brocadiia bacterium]